MMDGLGSRGERYMKIASSDNKQFSKELLQLDSKMVPRWDPAMSKMYPQIEQNNFKWEPKYNRNAQGGCPASL